jgi:hypothetical protein
MRCVGRFYAIAKNDIFLVEKAVKQFFIYFSMTGGASSYEFYSIRDGHYVGH